MPAAIAGAKALAATEESKTSQQLAKIAEDTPEMRAAARMFARRQEIKQAVLLKLYRPLEKWVGVSSAYFEGPFLEDIAGKVADIPEQNLTEPRPSVAVPAMLGLGYSLDEPDLKEMYLNLLATASDDRRRDRAHPSFAEIIRQLSGGEASLLDGVLGTRNALPIVSLHQTNPGVPGYLIRQSNLLNLRRKEEGEPIEIPASAMWVDNWVRLGLVDVDYTRYLTKPDSYEWVDGRPEVVRLRGAGETIEFQRGCLRVTDFGREFAAAVGGFSAAGRDTSEPKGSAGETEGAA